MKSGRIFLSPPHMSGYEKEFIDDAFESNYIAPLGPQVDAFEKEFAEYVGLKHSVALSSGTAATHLALRILEVSEGDVVFASTLTFIGSVSPITFLGAIPVFIDSNRETWNMNPDLLERELEQCNENGQLPKAVIPTDLYGQCCNLPRIVDICDRYDIPVICDSAEAMGSRFRRSFSGFQILDEGNQTSDFGVRTSGFWKHAGAGAKAVVYSFNGNKIITTSGGGMLASDDKVFIDYARFLSQQARDPLSHYEHKEIGYNYRMSNILAAIGRGQLRVLDDRVKRKREIFNYYRNAMLDLPGIEFMPEASYCRSNRWLTVIFVTPEKFGADREKIRLALEAENIESRPVWKPMHLQPVFDCQPNRKEDGTLGNGSAKKGKKPKKRYRARVVGGSVAEDLFDRGLCLPSGTAMTEADIDRVVSIIKKAAELGDSFDT
jgi:dTDP-4-amino-4,6-dideoxygalactose transaminase